MLGLRPALEHYPGGLDRVGVADAQRDLARVIAGDAKDNAADAIPQLLDRLVALEHAAAELVQNPFRASNRNLPVGDPLQVTADCCLGQCRLGDERHRRGQLGVDELGGFTGSFQRAVQDASNAEVA